MTGSIIYSAWKEGSQITEQVTAKEVDPETVNTLETSKTRITAKSAFFSNLFRRVWCRVFVFKSVMHFTKRFHVDDTKKRGK